MSKIKAKLTALLMTACCCLACIGIGVSFNKANNVVANAATTEELTAEFTNNGQFALATSSKTTGGYTVVDSTTAQSTLPNGYSGAVLEIYHSSSGSYDFVTVDFSNSKIPAKDVVSIVVRVWVDNYNYTDDSTDNDDEFRTIGAVTGTQRQYGIGKLNVEDTWTDVALTAGSITDMTDAYGYLNAIDLGLRDKGGASHVYIDSVTVNCVEWETVNVGKVDLYSNGSNETSLARLNLKPIDQTVAWYNTNDNFIYESGTGLQVIRNDEVVFSENRALANRNSALGKDSNVKYFYLDISKIDIQAGDVVKYGGTFYNTNSGMKYVIEDSEVLWDGAFWGKNTEYTTHNTGALTIRSSISSGKAIYAKTAETMPFKGWGNAFYLESGTGLLINCESATMNSMQSPTEGMYFTFNQVTEVGTELTIGGTFYCPTQKLKYVIPDTKFVWNGSAWENYIEYTKYNLGALKFQQVGGDGN